MVEKLFHSTQKQRAWLWQRAAIMPLRGWIVLMVATAVLGRYFSVSGIGLHRQEITAAYGTTGLLYGIPQADPQGRQITFSQMSDQGIGVFRLNISTGQKQLLHEKLPLDDPWVTLEVWPWSPDGKLFLYSHANLFVCQSATGEVVAKLPIEGLREGQPAGAWDFNGVKALTWLDAESFVYISQQRNLHWFQKSVGGQWQERPAGVRAGLTGLTTLASNTIAWQKGNRIWSLNLATRATALVYEAKTNHLARFSYAKDTGEFLLCFSDHGVDSLWRMTNALSAPKLSPIEVQSPVRNMAWLNGRQPGCAYLSPHEAEHNTLTVHAAVDGGPVTLFSQGTVEAFTASPDGKKLFIVGAVSNEPSAGIWQYEASSGDLRNVVAYSEHPSIHARRMEAWHGFSAQRIEYYLYCPGDFDRKQNKKYSLIIGDTLFKRTDPEYQNRTHGPLWAPMLANCGAFVVIVDRDTWMGGIDQLGNRIMSVYEQLAKNPMIDTNRVFLFGTSAETSYLSRLVADKPELWAGVMLLNPAGLPDLFTLPAGKAAPKILISAGKAEGQADNFKNYQQNAGQRGVPVEYYVHAGSGHWLLGTQSFNERCQAMAQFIFDH